MNKKVILIGSLTYIVLLILSLVFYKERTTFLDAAYHLFAILKDGDFAIQNFRFGAFFTQSFPLIASKLGLSLTSIMMLYSVSFVMLHFLIFLICVLVFRSYKFGLAIVLFSTFMITDTFYWIQSELIQGLAIIVLYFSVLFFGQKTQNDSRNYWFFPVTVLLIITLAFLHPLLIFPFFFLLGFFYLNHKIEKKQLITSGIAFLLLYFIKLLFFKVEYDSLAMGAVKNFISLFPNYFNLQSHINFLKYLITDYYLFPIGFLVILAYYIKERQLMKLGFVIVSSLFYLFIINVSFPNGADQFYLESFYLILSIFVIFPLVFDVLPSYKSTTWLFALCFILAIRVGHIGINHKQFTERLEWLHSFHEDTLSKENQKLIISNKYAPMDLLKLTWATPYEFWILSTSETGHSASILFDENPEKFRWFLTERSKYLTRWGDFNYNSLPPKYFIFQDTSNYIIQE